MYIVRNISKPRKLLISGKELSMCNEETLFIEDLDIVKQFEKIQGITIVCRQTMKDEKATFPLIKQTKQSKKKENSQSDEFQSVNNGLGGVEV